MHAMVSKKLTVFEKSTQTLAEPRWSAKGSAALLSQSKFFNFHAVFQENFAE